MTGELNHQALYDYLGFEFVPAPETMFRDIHKLPAGHYLTADRTAGPRSPAYWDLSMASRADRAQLRGGGRTAAGAAGRGGEEPSDQRRAARRVPLRRTRLQRHRGHDAPAHLRAAADLHHRLSRQDLQRTRLRQHRRRHFDTEHQVLMIDDLKPEYVEKALWHLDEPMTDLSAVPLMLLCEQAREQVTVCLSGEGGDEIFAGYDRFKASRHQPPVTASCPRPLRQRRDRPTGRPAARPGRRRKGAINMLKRFIEGANLPAEGDHLRWQYFFERRAGRKPLQPTTSGRRSRPTPSGWCGNTRRAATRRRPRQPRDLPRYAVHDDRQRADEGRQDEHGQLAGDPRAAARPCARRIPGLPARRLEAEGADDQAYLPLGARRHPARQRSSTAASRATACRSSICCAASSSSIWCRC